MRRQGNKTLLTLLMIGGLVALLTLLAVFQYRWLGQISVAERQTMQTNLRSQGRGLQEEINKELELIASRLRVSIDEYRATGDNELAERHARWKASAAYPGLITSVFLARNDPDAQSNLWRLNEATKQFEPAQWPASFDDIQRRFSNQRRLAVANSEHLEQRREEERNIGSLIEHGYIDENVPAMVRFMVDLERRAEPKDQAEREHRRLETMETIRQAPMVIIVFDMDYIRQVFLPSLFRRRFTIDGSLDYDMSVAFRKTVEEKTEKSARRAEEQVSAAGDFAVNLFPGVGSSEFNRGSRWQIIINHRAGSLDAAVAQVRRRNLIVSFGILSLLALSTIIIIVISRRAQTLARKQMDFVAGVSHEFRTPLAVIHAVSENLADGLVTEKNQVEECGQVIRDDARRLAGMVEQVLEFAGATRGKSLYHRKPIDVGEVIDEVLTKYLSVKPTKALLVEKKIDPDLPSVLVDRSALESALRNIVDNAVKYGGAEPCSISIKAETGVSNDDHQVKVTIADQGIGIQPSELNQIFEPFYRGTDVVAAQIHGNGLGLSLVKNAIEANGGSISVTSAPGRGSAFTLSLPTSNGHRPNGNHG
jgi:signal transduction histidine kinase